jgi:hypothetical protein
MATKWRPFFTHRRIACLPLICLRTQHRLHHLSDAIVIGAQHVRIDSQRDRRTAVTKPPRDVDDIDAGAQQLAGVGMAQAAKRRLDAEPPNGRQGTRRQSSRARAAKRRIRDCCPSRTHLCRHRG